MERVRGAGIAVIFQEPATSFNPVMTVGDQVAEMIRTHSTCDARRQERVPSSGCAESAFLARKKPMTLIRMSCRAV